MDSLLLQHEPVLRDRLVFTIVQDSIRFEKFKKFVIKEDNGTREAKYLGTYRVVDKSVFRLCALSRMLSLMCFGEVEEEGKRKLRRMKIKGRISDDTKFAFVCFEFFTWDNKYDLG